MMRTPKTRADYVLMLVLAAVLVVVASAIGYVALTSDYVGWDLREHPDTARYFDTVSDPVPFLDGFESYQPMARGESQIEAKALTPTQTSNRTLPNAAYPQRDIEVMSVAGYSYCNTPGALTLTYFNDRLMEATFVPDDVATCRKALDTLYPELHRDDNGRIEIVDGNRRLATNLDLVMTEVGAALRTSPYLRWQDLRLTQSLQEWERRFGGKAQLKIDAGATREPQ